MKVRVRTRNSSGRRDNMCLSAVYVDNDGERSVVIQEASSIKVLENGTIEISTLFGDRKVLDGYGVREIDLIKNRIMLGKSGE